MVSENEAADQRRGRGRLLRATIDISARFASVGPSWERLLGWEARALIGDSFVVRVHPDDVEGAVGAIHSALSSGSVAAFTARYAHRDGTYRPVRWRLAPRIERLQLELEGRPVPEQPDGLRPGRETPR